VELVDGSGAVKADFHFDAFGGSTAEGPAAAACPIGFAGMLRDPTTGLYFDHARVYSPWEERFLSEDPSGEQGGLNPYDYCGDDPVNRLDPTGLSWIPNWVKTAVNKVGNAVATAAPYVQAGVADTGDFLGEAVVGLAEANFVPATIPAKSPLRPSAPNTLPGSLGRNNRPRPRVVQGIGEIGLGGGTDAVGFVAIPLTLGGSLVLEIPGSVVVVHGAGRWG